MINESIQIVRQPSLADLQERDTEFGKAYRNALADHAGELQQDASGESVRVNLRESVQTLGTELTRPTARAVNAEDGAAFFRRRVNRIIERISERYVQARRQNLKPDDSPLFHRTLQLLCCGLRRAHRQNADALDPVGKGVVFRGEMIVASACHGDLERQLLKPDDAAGTGRKTDRGLDLMLVHQFVPAGDLFAGGELAPDSF